MARKQFYIDELLYVDRHVRAGLVTFTEAESLMFKITESARYALDSKDWMSVKRKSWRMLLDLTKGF